MIIINKNTPEKIADFLEKYDDTFRIPPLKNIIGITSEHTDLACCLIEKTIIAAPEIYRILSESNFKVKKGKKIPESPYPGDIPYNAAQIGDFLICKKNFTDSEIIAEAEENGKIIINVNQGYSKCSIVKVSDNAIITSDIGIHKRVSDFGIASLLISPGNIFLKGYNSGFIGGATVKIKNTLLFTGDISEHPDFNKIENFCYDFGIKTDYIKNYPLTDIGSPIFIEN